MFKIITIFGVALTLVAEIEATDRGFTLEIYNVSCQTFGTRMKFCECDCQKTETGEYLLNKRFMFDKDLSKQLILHQLIDIKPQYSQKRIRFIDFKINICEALETPFEKHLLRSIMAEFKRSTNLPFVCPIKGNYLYETENFTMKAEYLPYYTPALNYTYTLEYHEADKIFAVFKVLGAVVRRNLLKMAKKL